MTNMTNMTNMHNDKYVKYTRNMQIPFTYEHPFKNMNTPFSILPILQICKIYATNMNTPYFYMQKNIKYGKNAEYDNHPPGLIAAVRPGGMKKKYDKNAKYAKYAE